MSNSSLAIVLAGGRGTRLDPLTRERAKPAVPFAGGYRIIDFPLSNCLNSGLRQVLVLTQYKSLSLDRHLDMAWKPLFQRELGAYLEVIPPQQRISDDWYRGTADAVYQNIYSIDQNLPDDVVILAGDHIYAMDYREMLQFHRDRKADITIGAYHVPVSEAARRFGVIQADRSQQVVGFEEKPAEPTPVPGDPQRAYASMGIYVFRTKYLMETLYENATRPGSGHDFGHHILPAAIQNSRVFAFPFHAPGGVGKAYWKDVGTIDAYFDATQDLLTCDSALRLDDTQWPIRTFRPDLPPAMFLSDKHEAQQACVCDSIVCPGSRVVGASVVQSVLGCRSRVAAGSELTESIVLGDVSIGRGVQLYRTIVDKFSQIPDGIKIGFDPEVDEARGFTVSEGGITVVPRGYQAPPRQPVSPDPASSVLPLRKRRVPSTIVAR